MNASATSSHVPYRAKQSRRGWGIAALMVAFIILAIVLREHWGHIAGYWPYALLLLCPLMHVFGHGHHGNGHEHHQNRTTATRSDEDNE